jgi:outer membrane murein-binding lipoprotein Lpp
MSARAVLLILLTLGFARLTAAEPEELASLRAKAEKGSVLAQYNLGLAYAQGRLGPVDLPEAFAWLSLASESGTTGKALDGVLGSITDEQLTEGRRRLGTYRTALAAKNTSSRANQKLTPRGFSLNAPPATAPPTSETAPATKIPEATLTPATTPAEGSDSSELTQSRRELTKVRADLLATSADFDALRASIGRLEAAVADAKATEARLTAELTAIRRELEAAKPPAARTSAENSPAQNPAPTRP